MGQGIYYDLGSKNNNNIFLFFVVKQPTIIYYIWSTHPTATAALLTMKKYFSPWQETSKISSVLLKPDINSHANTV